MRTIIRLHDATIYISYVIGACLFGIITLLYFYECIVRYAFNAPTGWTYDAGNYFLMAGIFFTLPHLTRTGGNIAVTFIVDRLPSRIYRIISFSLALISSVICLTAGYIIYIEMCRQFSNNITTMCNLELPKCWLTVIIVYGFVNSGLAFLRNALDKYSL